MPGCDVIGINEQYHRALQYFSFNILTLAQYIDEMSSMLLQDLNRTRDFFHAKISLQLEEQKSGSRCQYV